MSGRAAGAKGLSAARTTGPAVTLRPITEDDQPFPYNVYASTREDEMAQVDWDAARKASVIDTGIYHFVSLSTSFP